MTSQSSSLDLPKVTRETLSGAARLQLSKKMQSLEENQSILRTEMHKLSYVGRNSTSGDSQCARTQRRMAGAKFRHIFSENVRRLHLLMNEIMKKTNHRLPEIDGTPRDGRTC